RRGGRVPGHRGDRQGDQRRPRADAQPADRDGLRRPGLRRRRDDPGGGGRPGPRRGPRRAVAVLQATRLTTMREEGEPLEMAAMSIDPAKLRYTKSHEWAHLSVEADTGVVTVGITQFAADQLTDVTYVELPKVGQRLTPGKEFGNIETVKAVSDLYAP